MQENESTPEQLHTVYVEYNNDGDRAIRFMGKVFIACVIFRVVCGSMFKE